MAVSLSLLAGAGWQFLDDNANPLTGGLLYTYAAGTTTPLATYTSSSGSTPNTNPIVLDAAGRVSQEVWLSTTSDYKFILKSSTGVTIWTKDDIPGGLSSDAVSFLQAGTGAVERTAQAKMRDFISVTDFGAVGDGVTDDTVAIQKAIDYATSVNGIRRILFKWNHLVTDINITKRFNCGLIFEGQNASNQDGTGSNVEGTIIVTGAASQGLDLSGSTGITFRNITIAGDTASPPRCAFFLSRVVGANYCSEHQFDNVNTYGSFSRAAVYNYAGEGTRWNNCALHNNSATGHVWYGTSKNSLGLASKFQTPDETVTPLTVTYFDGCVFHNAFGSGAATSTYGVWFERDRVRGGDRTINNISLRSCYLAGRGTASLRLEEVDGTVGYYNNTDESLATANPDDNDFAIQVVGSSYLSGLTIIGSTFFGGAVRILQGSNIENFTWESCYAYNAKGVQITNLFGAFVSKWMSAHGVFQVTNTAFRCYIYPENESTENAYISLNGAANCAIAERVFNGPNSSLAATQVGQPAWDYVHRRAFNAQAGGAFDWSEVLQPPLGNTAPASGNFIFGQWTRLYGFGALVAGSSLGLVCTNTGTAGTLVGITGSINISTTSLTVNATTGLSVGNYITIAGVSGRKQITAINGLVVTIDTNADATVAGAAVAYSAPAFIEFGTTKAQDSVSWTPGTIANNASAGTNVGVGTAALGDLAIASFSLDLQDCTIAAHVSSAGTVRVVITNNTGGPITLGAGTARARVFKA